MGDSGLRLADVDIVEVQKAFARDTDYHDTYPRSRVLDLQTGEVHRFYESDKDAWADMGDEVASVNSEIRKQVEATPDRYLAIPGLNHGDCHCVS